METAHEFDEDDEKRRELLGDTFSVPDSASRTLFPIARRKESQVIFLGELL